MSAPIPMRFVMIRIEAGKACLRFWDRQDNAYSKVYDGAVFVTTIQYLLSDSSEHCVAGLQALGLVQDSREHWQLPFDDGTIGDMQTDGALWGLLDSIHGHPDRVQTLVLFIQQGLPFTFQPFFEPPS